ncbi:hypothetical protein AAXB25_14925 [Paenibacillus lautus]|uniref:hypothetical protein n=1 Tax=Paenibacillus lautus TaxID=1401 RepID=UPI003D28752B
MPKENDKLYVGCEVLYINSCIFNVISMDENGENLTIESEFEKYYNVSKNDVMVV